MNSFVIPDHCSTDYGKIHDAPRMRLSLVGSNLGCALVPRSRSQKGKATFLLSTDQSKPQYEACQILEEVSSHAYIRLTAF